MVCGISDDLIIFEKYFNKKKMADGGHIEQKLPIRVIFFYCRNLQLEIGFFLARVVYDFNELI